MQLFITEFEKKWESIKISNSEILSQIRKVLRMKIWDKFFVQNENIRYQLKITDRNDKDIFWNVIDRIDYSEPVNENWITIAMSNKRDKMETIVQKLSEIWIKHIYFRPSERSIIREWNAKKLERINKIAKEAIEQSRWWFLPEIKFEKNISWIIKWKNIVVFDKRENEIYSPLLKGDCSHAKQDRGIFKNPNAVQVIWIIWPEWWLTDNDYKTFWNNIKTVSLWDTVLRTETASIIAARTIKNIF